MANSTLRSQVLMFVEGPAFNPEGLNYIDCPECGGVQKMLVVSGDDGLFYKCFKVTCAASGRANGTPASRSTAAKAAPTRNKYMAYPHPKPLTDEDYRFMEERWHISQQQADRLCCGTIESIPARFIFPIYDYSGRIVGETHRSIQNPGPYPKALVRPFHSTGSLASWYWSADPRSDTWVIVEDQPSAVRLSRHYSTIALLGTSLGPETAQLIQTWVPKASTVIVALDADATVKCVKMGRQLRSMRDAISMPLRGVDIKDMSSHHFEQYIAELEYVRG